jgi:signal transduction histidine kinase
MAANEDGLWSKAPASMAFTIRPMFIETWWFIGVCVVLVALLIYLLHTARLNLARRRMRERMQERLVERERIARTLHDTFLQSVVGLTLRFQSVANNLPEDGPWRAKLESALVQADQIIDEGRGAVLGLRLSADMFANLDDVFRETGRALSENYIAGFSFMASGGRREVVAQVRDEIYHIGREAMFNAFQHAQASTIEAILHYGADALVLTIRDDGAGMDQEILRQGKRPGHWGLTGMRERADGLGADLFIRSRPGKGTEVVIEVPARVAYTQKHKPSRLRFWRR